MKFLNKLNKCRSFTRKSACQYAVRSVRLPASHLLHVESESNRLIAAPDSRLICCLAASHGIFSLINVLIPTSTTTVHLTYCRGNIANRTVVFGRSGGRLKVNSVVWGKIWLDFLHVLHLVLEL